MYSALAFVKDQLTGNSTITDEIAAGNMYPVLASDTVTGDFLTFSVQSVGVVTKERLSEYSVTINVFGNTILEAAQKGDVISTELVNNSFRLQSEGIQYTEDLQRAYINLVFNFKI